MASSSIPDGDERQRRAQAELISAWPASRPPAAAAEQRTGEEADRTWINLLNRSDAPVHRAVVALVAIQGGGPRNGKETPPPFRTTLNVIPPGKQYTSVAPFFPSMSAKPGVELAFTDRAGVHWVRSAEGVLIEIDEDPIDYYGLDLPQDWSIPIPDER